MEAEEQRQMSQHEGEGENEASLSLPCGRQKSNTYFLGVEFGYFSGVFCVGTCRQSPKLVNLINGYGSLSIMSVHKPTLIFFAASQYVRLCPYHNHIEGKTGSYTTLQSTRIANLSHQSSWHSHEKGLVKIILILPHIP